MEMRVESGAVHSWWVSDFGLRFDDFKIAILGRWGAGVIGLWLGLELGLKLDRGRKVERGVMSVP